MNQNQLSDRSRDLFECAKTGEPIYFNDGHSEGWRVKRVVHMQVVGIDQEVACIEKPNGQHEMLHPSFLRTKPEDRDVAQGCNPPKLLRWQVGEHEGFRLLHGHERVDSYPDIETWDPANRKWVPGNACVSGQTCWRTKLPCKVVKRLMVPGDFNGKWMWVHDNKIAMNRRALYGMMSSHLTESLIEHYHANGWRWCQNTVLHQDSVVCSARWKSFEIEVS